MGGFASLRSESPVEFTPSTLAFSARKGTPLSRRNLLNRQLKPDGDEPFIERNRRVLKDAPGFRVELLVALLRHALPDAARG